MGNKNLKTILDEGGYIDYRNIFKSLEKKSYEDIGHNEIITDENDFESELPDWIQNKWKKYDMKDWGK